MSESKSEEGSENICVVCCREVYIYAIGECDHPVCFECATRMRVLCRQNECPICRRELPKIIFVKERKQYADVASVAYPLQDRRYNVYFEDSFVQKAHSKLLEHCCYNCEKEPSFPTFHLLREHVRRAHELFFCEICTKHLLIFTCERKCYNRQELATHKRRGDVDDTSHRGHPLCEFCDDRFLDDDELFRHLRREHFFCHFCDTDGHNHYYSDYEYLRKHFRAEHYLCEEGECINEKFTTAFRSEIDLIAHRASVHNRGLTKAQAKQARTLDLEFSIAPRGASNADDMPSRSYNDGDDANARRGRRRGGYSHRGGREFSHPYYSRNDISEEISDSSNLPHNHVPPSPKIDMSSSQDFPILGSVPSNSAAFSDVVPSASSAPDTMARKLAKINRFTVGSGLGNDEFPALHSGSGGPAVSKLASKFKGSNSWGTSGSATLSLTSSQAPSPSAKSRKTLTVKLNSQDDFPGLGNENRHRPVPNVSIQVDHKQKMAKPTPTVNASSTGSSERQPVITRLASSQNIRFLNPPASVQANSNPTPSAPDSTSEVKPPEFVQGLPKTDSGWYVLKKGKLTKSKSPPDETKLTELSLEEDFPSLAVRNISQKTRKEPTGNRPAQNSWKVELDVQKSPEKGNSPKSASTTKGKKKKKSVLNGGECENEPKTTGTVELKNTENGADSSNRITPPREDVRSEEKGGEKVKRSEFKLDVVTPLGTNEDAEAVLNKDLFTAEDFPNLALKPTRVPAKRRSELKVASLAPPTITSSIASKKETEIENLKNGNIFSPNDFPNLTSKSSNKVGAPPGFDTKLSRPPPGFVPVAPPPGFNAVDNALPESQHSNSTTTFPNNIGQNFSFPQPIPCHAYAQPDGFQKRNHELTERLHRILGGDVEKFNAFKDISGMFRKGVISAEEYYDRCVELMSKPKFDGIFPELLVLLPDIAKQQELLVVYNSAKRVMASSNHQASGATFLICASCQQVLAGKDFRSHESTHSLDNNFPTLDNLIHTSHIDWVKRN